jgi:tetratricopeptide (TPR) repeat protein
LLTSETVDKNTILVAIIMLLVGFIGGFLLANSINRSEINAIRSQAQQVTVSNTANKADDPSLSPEEIKAKVAEADKNPNNFSYQKDLGIGLYQYGVIKQNADVLSEAARVLARANSLDAKDFDVLVNLGNAYFDIGFARKDATMFAKARDAYNQALAIRPDDPNVRTDLGISYYVQPTPDYPKAAVELQNVLAANPQHDRSMLFLAKVYVEQGKMADAGKLLAKLKDLNPRNPAIGELTAQIESAKNDAK